MLNLKLTLNLRNSYLIILLMLGITSLHAQCILNVSDLNNPSSCYATDGSFQVTSVNGGCNRLISVYKNSVLLAQGSGTINISGQGAGDFEVVSPATCGCASPSSKVVTLFAGSPTPLIPYVNSGAGQYQADKVFICRGGNVSLGVQSLGWAGLSISGPNGYFDNTPDGSSFWNFTNLQPIHSGTYTVRFTNINGCVSTRNIVLTVGSLNLNAGSDKAGCPGTSHTLEANVSGQSVCSNTCPSTLDSLLVVWSLDQCNASTQTQQNSYTEFIPTYPSNGNCTQIGATNVYRDQGEHSCTPVLGSYSGDIGMCVPAMESCDPSEYTPEHAVKFEVTLTPQEAGRITKLSFVEQSPLVWITTNGSTGPNNYNTKYLLRVYKNGLLIYSEDDRNTEKTWNLEEFDFSTNPAFAITEAATFRFELRGYCVNNVGGNMSGWELNDIRIFGGCCSGLTTYNDVSFLWSTGETTSSISVNPSTTTDYTVTVKDCNGCTFSDDVKVGVHPLPTPAITGTPAICVGGSSVLTASGGTAYVWSSGETTTSITVSPTATTTYNVTVTSDKGCSASTNFTVVVNPLPSPVISGDFVICIGESTLLTASGGITFEWSTGATTSSITVSPTVNTTYLVMVTDENGCQEFTEVLVQVNPLPVPVISGNSVICAGQQTTLTASGGTTYLWSTGETSPDIDVSPTTSTTYTVTVTDINGCFATKTKTVNVNPLPVPVISGNSSFCTGTSSVLTASGGVTYVWSTGATTTSININPGLNTTYTVTVTDVNGCTASVSRMANVMSLPIAEITGVNEICKGSTTSLTASGGVIFLWNTGDAANTITVSPEETTIYRVTVTDNNGCTGTSAHAVTVHENPTVTISGDDEFCIGGSTNLTADVIGKTYCEKDCTKELMINWTMDQCNSDGVANQRDYSEFVGDLISNCNLENVTNTNAFRDRGDHSCTPDGNGGVGLCIGTLSSCDPNDYDPINALRFNVTVDPVELGKLTKLTFREQSPINWLTTNGSTGINNYNEKYLIRVYKNGVLVYAKNDIATERIWNLETFDFTDHPEFTITEQTIFSFELYGYCVVDNGGTPGWEIDDIRLYGGECPSSPVVENVSYLWSTGATTSNINVAPSISTTYSVTVTDCNGCQGSDQHTITVHPLPTPSISGDKEICTGASTTLIARGGTTYVWSNGATEASITVSPTATTTYNVTVTDGNGCQASASVTVKVNPLPTPSITGDTEICTGAEHNIDS
ncbi:MAG: hypothetical protein IPO48_07500 [Saprospiraceae bacterium]|nr:hypothetical protein [Saprospiraceae bacterium]